MYQEGDHQECRTLGSAMSLLMVSHWGHIGVKVCAWCKDHGAAFPMNSSFRGRWDRNRTCNLRLWSTRRGVQMRLASSKLPLNPQISAVDRPGSSENVQPVCSQFCSQCTSIATRHRTRSRSPCTRRTAHTCVRRHRVTRTEMDLRPPCSMW
jgi:hypothetical protein